MANTGNPEIATFSDSDIKEGIIKMACDLLRNSPFMMVARTVMKCGTWAKIQHTGPEREKVVMDAIQGAIHAMTNHLHVTGMTWVIEAIRTTDELVLRLEYTPRKGKVKYTVKITKNKPECLLAYQKAEGGPELSKSEILRMFNMPDHI